MLSEHRGVDLLAARVAVVVVVVGAPARHEAVGDRRACRRRGGRGPAPRRTCSGSAASERTILLLKRLAPVVDAERSVTRKPISAGWLFASTAAMKPSRRTGGDRDLRAAVLRRVRVALRPVHLHRAVVGRP